jgi:hypothetical protein
MVSDVRVVRTTVSPTATRAAAVLTTAASTGCTPSHGMWCRKCEYASPLKTSSDRGCSTSLNATAAVSTGTASSLRRRGRKWNTTGERSDRMATRSRYEGPSVCGRMPSLGAYSFTRQWFGGADASKTPSATVKEHACAHAADNA